MRIALQAPHRGVAYDDACHDGRPFAPCVGRHDRVVDPVGLGVLGLGAVRDRDVERVVPARQVRHREFKLGKAQHEIIRLAVDLRSLIAIMRCSRSRG